MSALHRIWPGAQLPRQPFTPPQLESEMQVVLVHTVPPSQNPFPMHWKYALLVHFVSPGLQSPQVPSEATQMFAHAGWSTQAVPVELHCCEVLPTQRKPPGLQPHVPGAAALPPHVNPAAQAL